MGSGDNRGSAGAGWGDSSGSWSGGGGGPGGKYVPPSRRGMSDAQARITGDSMPDRRPREDTAAIRVSNLSENVQEQDLQVRINIIDIKY